MFSVGFDYCKVRLALNNLIVDVNVVLSSGKIVDVYFTEFVINY